MAKVKLTKTTTRDTLGTVNRIKTYVGFSTVNRDFDSNTLYDYELARTDLLNAFYIKKGEKLENPNYGTIIHDTLFEPFTSEISTAVEEDVIEIVDKDPSSIFIVHDGITTSVPMDENNIDYINIITSDYHMPRSMLILRKKSKNLTFFADPVIVAPPPVSLA